MILINANIIDPTQEIKDSTKRHLKEYRDTIRDFESVQSSVDPIDRSFFKDKVADFKLNDYLFSRGKQTGDLLGQQELAMVGNVVEPSRVEILNEQLKGFDKKGASKKPKKEKKEKKSPCNI